MKRRKMERRKMKRRKKIRKKIRKTPQMKRMEFKWIQMLTNY